MEGSSGKSLSYIVGGSRGMGLAIARLLVADGGTVVLVAREQDKLAARKGELEAGGRGKVETLWAERFDGDMSDLFALQDEITSRIAIALKLQLPAAEAARRTEHPDALDYI